MNKYSFTHDGSKISYWGGFSGQPGGTLAECLAIAKDMGLTWDEDMLPKETVPPAVAALAEAEENGIPIPFGESIIYLRCGERDRSMFSGALTLYRTYEDLLPSEEAKAAFRASTVTFADASGVPHDLTVEQARQMLVMYGVSYQTLWAAAVAAEG